MEPKDPSIGPDPGCDHERAAEYMFQSPAMDKIATALAKAQGEMNNAEKGGFNPHFKAYFSGLSDVIDAIREPLTKNGICWTQLPYVDPRGDLFIRTRLIHSSGQYLEGVVPILYAQKTPQAMGSAITYAKRYGLQAICGIASKDEDDDGEHAMGSAPDKKPPLKKPPVKNTPRDSERVTEVKAVAEAHKWTGAQVKEVLLAECDGITIDKLSQDQYSRLIHLMKRMNFEGWFNYPPTEPPSA